MFEPLVTPQVQTSPNSSPSERASPISQTSNGTQFSIKSPRGAEARATVTSEGIVVLENSYAAQDEVESTPDSTRKLRKKLVDDGTLVLRDARFRFSQNVLFATPSLAASVVLGRSANGRVELLDEAGRTLKYLEESVVVA